MYGWRLWCTAQYRKKRVQHGSQKEYANIYGRLVNTSKTQMIGNITEFVIKRIWDEVTVQKEGLSSGERSEKVMELSKTTTKVWTVRFVPGQSISV